MTLLASRKMEDIPQGCLVRENTG